MQTGIKKRDGEENAPSHKKRHARPSADLRTVVFSGSTMLS